MSNLIQIDGGVKGTSAYDKTAGSVVALEGSVGYTTYAWSFIYFPESAAPSFSDPTGQTSNFTPTAGWDGHCWGVKLIVDEGLATEDQDIVWVGCPDANGWIIPGYGMTQTNSDKTGGWSNKDWGLPKLLKDIKDGVVGGTGPSDTHTAGRDDLDLLDAWTFETSGDATITRAAGAAAYGFPSSGVLALGCGTGSARATALRTGIALVLDATIPIVVGYRWRPMASGVYDDTEHTRMMGIARGDTDEAIVLVTSNGTSWLALISGGSPIELESVTLPALDTGEKAYRLRLTVTPTGATLEVSIDDGDWSTIGILTAAIPEETYHPFLQVDPDGGAGDRSLLVDEVIWSGSRLSEDAGATPPAFTNALPTTAHNSLTGLTTGDPHTQYAKTDGSRAITGSQVFGANIAVAGDVLANNVYAATNVVATGNLFANSGTEQALTDATGAPLSHVGTGGSAHADATDSASGFQSAEDYDRANDRKSSILINEEFDRAPNMTSSPTGAGAQATIQGAGEAGVYGYALMETGSTATGQFYYYSSTMVRLGDGSVRLDYVLKVPVLSTALEEFAIHLGHSNNGSTEPGSGAYFTYQRGTSVNWLGRTASGGIRTTVDSGIPVTTGWVRLSVRWNAAGTSCDFYINGVLVGTSTTNVPTTNAAPYVIAAIVKSVGTTNRTMLLDLLQIRKSFSPARS